MKLLPSGEHDGPKPITPMIKIFTGMIVGNALAGVLIVAFVLFRAGLTVKAATESVVSPTAPKLILCGFLAFEIILFGTFLLLNRQSAPS
jgi:hypothetical protein